MYRFGMSHVNLTSKQYLLLSVIVLFLSGLTCTTLCAVDVDINENYVLLHCKLINKRNIKGKRLTVQYQITDQYWGHRRDWIGEKITKHLVITKDGWNEKKVTVHKEEPEIGQEFIFRLTQRKLTFYTDSCYDADLIYYLDQDQENTFSSAIVNGNMVYATSFGYSKEEYLAYMKFLKQLYTASMDKRNKKTAVEAHLRKSARILNPRILYWFNNWFYEYPEGKQVLVTGEKRTTYVPDDEVCVALWPIADQFASDRNKQWRIDPMRPKKFQETYQRCTNLSDMSMFINAIDENYDDDKHFARCLKALFDEILNDKDAPADPERTLTSHFASFDYSLNTDTMDVIRWLLNGFLNSADRDIALYAAYQIVYNKEEYGRVIFNTKHKIKPAFQHPEVVGILTGKIDYYKDILGYTTSSDD